MNRYSRRFSEDLVVPNYQETSDSYPSPDIWGRWIMNSQKSAEKCFDFDVIDNGFSGGLYSHMEMGTSEEVEVEEESKRLKSAGCFYNSASLLHGFDEIQHMDDIFLSSILEDVPGNGNQPDGSPSSSSAAYLDTLDGIEVPMFHYNRETCHDIPLLEEDMEEPSTEKLVLQDLQRATEKLTDDTRKCFRDTFYRLAKNSQQKSESGNTNLEEFLENRISGSRYQKTESKTNSMDRAVANLTLNKMESNMRNLPQTKRVSYNQG